MTHDSFHGARVDESLVQIISASPIITIDDAIKVMQGLDDILPSEDGLKWFNLLYLKVTQGLQTNPPVDGWENPRFLERLAVIFAGLYFETVATSHRDENSMARAWSPLFKSRHRRGVARFQFAVAGMNARINHDLPIALVQTSEEQGGIPRRGSPEHRDFEKVNTILEPVAAEAKQSLATGVVGEIDQGPGRLDDMIALWSVRKARETAWTNGEILWQLRGIPTLKDAFLKNLDRLVGLSTRGLLIPVG